MLSSLPTDNKATHATRREPCMDKRKVIAAYRRGLISVQECAQILGLDNVELLDYMRDPRAPRPKAIKKQSVRT